MGSNLTYRTHLASKKKRLHGCGFVVEERVLNKHLFDFQRYCVKVALAKGRFCLFEDCGLGKTLQQLVWAEEVVRYSGGRVLVLSPLSVTEQTIEEGAKFGILVKRYEDGVDGVDGVGVYITNYEQLVHIDVGRFVGVVLDESSILKNFSGAIRNLIIEKFRGTAYKLACSATPSPNDPMELGNHAEFLGVMSRVEMLAMYFVHDGGNTSAWRLKRHAAGAFWSWVSSWAIMITKPSDIGFSDVGYDLPPLRIVEERLLTAKVDNGLLFNDVAVSATNFNAELRRTMDDRVAKVAGIVNGSDSSFIVWVKHNEEAKMLRNLIPGSVEVCGSEDAGVKKRKLLGFGKNEFRVLITKQKIAQYGLNYQNCSHQVFASLDFSFEGLYQAIRRSWRFGQVNAVEIVLITTDTMENVKGSIDRKSAQFEVMKSGMISAMKSEFMGIDRVTGGVEFSLPPFL